MLLELLDHRVEPIVIVAVHAREDAVRRGVATGLERLEPALVLPALGHQRLDRRECRVVRADAAVGVMPLPFALHSPPPATSRAPSAPQPARAASRARRSAATSSSRSRTGGPIIAAACRMRAACSRLSIR